VKKILMRKDELSCPEAILKNCCGAHFNEKPDGTYVFLVLKRVGVAVVKSRISFRTLNALLLWKYYFYSPFTIFYGFSITTK